MAIGFKDVNEEPTTATTTSTSELPIYQNSAVIESEASTNITPHPLELTVLDSNIRSDRSEVDSSLKNINHKSEVNSGAIGVKIAEMVKYIFNKFNLLLLSF